MPTFVAVYHGQTVADAELIAVSADPVLVGDVAERLLVRNEGASDPVLASLSRGRRAALRLVKREAVHASR